MNHDDDYDDLDRALFALPLEEPPAGLRASILQATVYATPAPEAFNRMETVAVGVLLALASWLAIICATEHSLVLGLESLLSGFLAVLTDPRTVIWLGLGAAIAAFLTYGNGGSTFGFRSQSGRPS